MHHTTTSHPALPRLEVPDTVQGSDDRDPSRLLKLSHSLRYQLKQPLRYSSRRTQADQQQQQQPQLSPYGSLASAGPFATPDASQQLYQHPQGPSPGTRSGPYTGLASKDWLTAEVAQDIDTLTRHVDAFVTRREHQAFQAERAALQQENAALRQQLSEAHQKVLKLELMLPDDNGEFGRLRRELDELEQEADHFCDLYEGERKAVAAAVKGYRLALEVVSEIELELDRMRDIMATVPDPPGLGRGGAGAGAGGGWGAARGDGRPGPDQADEKACCFCFTMRRRR